VFNSYYRDKKVVGGVFVLRFRALQSTAAGSKIVVISDDETLSNLNLQIAGAAATIPSRLHMHSSFTGQLYGRTRQSITPDDLILLTASGNRTIDS
jgi:hypothetical protein